MKGLGFPHPGLFAFMPLDKCKEKPYLCIMTKLKVSSYAKKLKISRKRAYDLLNRGYDTKNRKIKTELIDGILFVLPTKRQLADFQ